MLFRYTILYVPDVAASLRFFQEAFGLECGLLHESGEYGELATGGTKLAFSSTALMSSLGKNPSLPSASNPSFEISFEVEDVTAALARALRAGADLVQDVRDEPWGQTTAYVRDGNGFLIGLCSATMA